MDKPFPGEYNPYFERYIGLVSAGNFQDILSQNTQAVISFFRSLPASLHDFAYAEGKWTVRQILLHMSDTERVMQYRTLVAARGDRDARLPSMDEHLYGQHALVGNRALADLLDEFVTVRKASEYLLLNLNDEQTRYTTEAAGFPVTPRALGYIIVGHTLHHINVIKERYLKH